MKDYLWELLFVVVCLIVVAAFFFMIIWGVAHVMLRHPDPEQSFLDRPGYSSNFK